MCVWVGGGSQLQQTTFINIFHCFSEKIRLDVSSESSARQSIHLKNQALFSSKDNSKKSKCRVLQFLFGALRVKYCCRHNERLISCAITDREYFLVVLPFFKLLNR